MTDMCSGPRDADEIRREAIDFAGIGLYRYRFDGTLLFADAGALRILEVAHLFADPAEVVGRKIEDLIIYEGPHGLLRGQILARGRVRNFEYPFRTLAGRRKWALHDSYRVRDEATGQDAIQVIIRDITDLKMVEEALRSSEEHLRWVVETVPAGIAIVSPSDTIDLVNAAGAAILGRSREDILGRSRADPTGRLSTLGGSPLPLGQRVVARVRAEGRPVYGVEAALERPDGSRAVISFNAAPLSRPPGACILAFHDITTRAELDRLKGEFLSVASHELRTPLTPLRLLVEQSRALLAEGRAVDDATLARIERQVRRLAEMVTDLLDVSRLERGQLTLRLAIVDLRDLVRSAVETYRARAPRRSLEADLPGQPVMVTADATRIEQVLANLVENALRYTPEGSPIAVRVAVRAGSPRVEVADRGPGIDAADQPRLFQRFFRVAGRAAAAREGLGLGLYICREIVERHGGRVGLDSRPAEGCTFWFELPAMAPPAGS